MNATEVSIIIPSLIPDKHELTKRALSICLESLKESTTSKVIVAYNGEGTEYPQGQCGAVNRAVKETDTKWVIITNNDQVWTSQAMSQLLYAVDNFGLLVASPNLVEPQKGAPPFIEKYCGGLGTVGTDINFDKKCFLEFAENHGIDRTGAKSMQGRMGIEDGANLPFIVKRELWDLVNGYDTNFDPFSSNSDSDLFYKFLIAGVVPKRVRGSLVYHFSQTSGTFHPDNRSYWENNRRYFIEKWGFERASSPECWYKPTIPYNELKYKPSWMGHYGEPK